jgi:DNA modification methylase
VVLRNPSDIGFDGARYELPPLEYFEHVVEGQDVEGELFARPAMGLAERRKAQRASVEARCRALADVVNADTSEPWLIWCHLNDEAELLQSMIPGSVNVQGSDSQEFKVAATRWFVGDDSLQKTELCDKLSASERSLLGWTQRKSSDALTCASITKPTKKNSGPDLQKKGLSTTQTDERVMPLMETCRKNTGLPQKNGQQQTQRSGKLNESESMGLTPLDTTQCLSNKAEGVQYVDQAIAATDAAADFTLTTAIQLGSQEGFCAPTAITDLESSKTQSRLLSEQSNTLKRAPVLISKARMFGYGLNFQHCARMAFVGLDDSFEKFYQAVRRCYRFGQKRSVKVHLFTAENEGQILANLKRKEEAHHEMSAQMIEHMKDIMNHELAGQTNIVEEYREATHEGDGYTVHLGDCVKWAKRMADNSIDYSVFSPPFADLFVYSNSDHDMGNCKDDEEFAAQLKYLIAELFRVIKPGRNVSFHCMNLPTTKMRQGFIGLRDFRGTLIRAFQDAGFIYHSEVCIWKDPVVAMQRTKALGLLHKTIRENSTMSRMGLPDYVVTMRKPGECEERVTHGDDLPVLMWQKYASPIWDDINQSRTLNKLPARDENDEKHMCPLQLDVIERCIHLWTNKGDLVFSPFTGIGSEGYTAVKMGRRFVGTELKPQYWELACQNIDDAKQAETQDLFAA